MKFTLTDKGKPAARRGRKATGSHHEMAGPPKLGTMTKRIILSILCLTLIASVTPALAEQSPIRAIRFDPGYYYDHPESNDVQALADQLCGQWAQNGVNTIYYMAFL